ncbi:lipoprotein [Planococcus antarcticus DSM 14505]|uniref:Lipoprotein n=1 Tax=Planococcus antarcticus DSM 14505 TaxID=1185653 RepID=A0A1C7DDC6_9BACL|nr:hypothetical protein [Planococcus antarcticus]ANU09444.1 hypothetical protein BBH88_03520 [Planococcus antarcticus DSM 14505]EIM06076.1 lipoprotein [Planococcus antarcticus DSM 14505]
MKKAVYLLTLSAFLLGGCTEQADSTVVASAATGQNDIPAYYEDYVLSPQVTDDRMLQEVGQNKRDEKGEVTVKAVNMDKETYDVGPVDLTVAESKILQLQPDYSLIDFFHSYTHEQEFRVVKMFVEITNTSDEPLHFAPVALLETAAKELKIWEDDIYLEELNGELAAGETKRGNIGFIVKDGSFDWVTITTSDVYDSQEDKIAEALTFNKRFE